MNPIAQATATLTDVLSKEKELMTQLLCFAQEKEAALNQGDMAKLMETVPQEEELADAFRALEEERIMRSDELAHAAGLTDTDLSMREVIEKLNDPVCASCLRRVRQELLTMVNELAAQNEKVAILLEQQRDCNEFVLQMLLSDGDSSPYYDGNGEKQEQPSGDRGIYEMYV